MRWYQKNIIKSMALMVSCGLLSACGPQSSQELSEEIASTPDITLEQKDQSAKERVTGSPDIIMIEGFGNFIHHQSDGNDLAKLMKAALNAISYTGVCGTAGVDNDSQITRDSRLVMAQVYWCGFLYGIPGMNGSEGLLDVYQTAHDNQEFSGKVGYLHWDSGYRIGRSDNGINASQMYDNYDGLGSAGLFTRTNRLFNGTHGQPQALNHPFCQSYGCVYISHSTGGTVMDVMLAESLQNDSYTGFTGQGISVGGKYTFYDNANFGLQIASAAGGVGLSQWMIDVLNGAACGSTLEQTLGNAGLSGMTQDVIAYVASALFVNWQCGLVGSEGAGHDLKNAFARQGGNTYGSRSNYGGTPILMIAGTGTIVDLSEHGGIITSHLTSTGLNDGLVDLHSACGANVEAGYDSCHKHLNQEGWVGNYSAPVGDGVANTWSNHFSYMMTMEGHGSQIFKYATIQTVVNAGAEVFTFGAYDSTQYEMLVPDSNWDQYYEVGDPWDWEVDDRIQNKMSGATASDTTDQLRGRGESDFGIDVPELWSSSEDPDYDHCDQWSWGNCVKEVYRVERVYMNGYDKHLADLLGRYMDFRLVSTDISAQQ